VVKREEDKIQRAVIAPSFSDRPFGCPEDIVIDYPPAPSVNATRKIDWRSSSKYDRWKQSADNCVMSARCRVGNSIRSRKIDGRFEAVIVFDEATSRLDLDNGIKALLDHCKRSDLITDDSPKYLRKLTAQFGQAPMGCRVILRPME